MGTMMTIITAFLLLSPILIGAYYLTTYNGLQAATTQVDQGWSGIEVQLKRRHDLIPSLVSAVKSAMKHENDIFDKLVRARQGAMDAVAHGDKGQIAASEATLSSALQGFQLRVEDNPEITATGNIDTFQRQLEETEDQIAASRRLYNGNVQNLNQRIVTFPGNIIASRHAIDQATPFELQTEERAAVYAQPKIQLHD